MFTLISQYRNSGFGQGVPDQFITTEIAGSSETADITGKTIHDFANVTLAMPDGFDRVAPSPSWGHRVVSNNKQKFNNEVECKMCSK